jgi:hypothetical protein
MVALRLVGRLFAGLTLTTAAASPAAAQKLLVNTHDSGKYVYGGLHYRGGQWSKLTDVIDRQFSSVATVSTMSDLAFMLEHDALWVDQRFQTTASAAEIDNLLAFAATGRRVVVMGENATWGGWNSQVLTALGGMEGPLGGWTTPTHSGDVNWGAGCMNGRVMGLPTHALTIGVAGINVACAGYAIGGTQLFAYNVASLWRPQQNVLTILDGNIMDDLFAAYEGPVFRNRVVSWLAGEIAPQVAPERVADVARMSSAFDVDEGGFELASLPDAAILATPEPSAIALLALGGGALAATRRRARRA